MGSRNCRNLTFNPRSMTVPMREAPWELLVTTILQTHPQRKVKEVVVTEKVETRQSKIKLLLDQM
jgi:hypothetical protein